MRTEKFFIFVSFCGMARLFEELKEWDLMKYMPATRKENAKNVLACPIPGQVIEVLIKSGDRVYRGQNLVVLESMKMERDLASPVDGIVTAVHVVAGHSLEVDQILI